MSYYDYSYVMEDLMASMGASLLLNIPTFVMGIVTYVLTALSLYTIAKRRGLNHAWLSWIPVADMWILGSISDQYRYVARGQIKSKRKILIWLNVATCLIGVALTVCGMVLFFRGLQAAMYNISDEEVMTMILGPLLGSLGLLLPLLALSVTAAIFQYMALYDLYMSCEPNNGVLFLVLSILISVTQPFFLIFIRNKDNGMPPRRNEIPAAPVYQNQTAPNSWPQNPQAPVSQPQSWQAPNAQAPEIPQAAETDEEHFL